MRDLMNNLHLVPAFDPKAAVTDNTAQVSTIFDTRDVTAVMLAFQTGTLSDADATFTVLLEESDASNMAGANAVADEYLNGTEALAGFQFDDDSKCRKLGYTGVKRYIRATITPANNTGNIFLAGMWVSQPRRVPTANPPA